MCKHVQSKVLLACQKHVASNSLYLISFASFTLLTYLISPKEEIPKYLSWDYLKLNYLIFYEPITDAQYPSLKKKISILWVSFRAYF
jgi:hypothetical protein